MYVAYNLNISIAISVSYFIKLQIVVLYNTQSYPFMYKDILAYLERPHSFNRLFKSYKFIFIIQVLQLCTNVQKMK